MRTMSSGERITYFAQTDARGRRIPFGIKEKDRSRHMYVIGKTGMGKSTLLENMAIQDIQSGNGLAFIDPHGKSAELLLDYIPKERVNDVLYFAPFDLEHPVSFNIMEDIGPEKRHLVVSGLMSAFKKLFGEESFSDRMQYMLQNTILALLEYPGATLLGVNRMLAEKDYRQKVIARITDPSVKTYWTKEYAGYTERFAAEAIPAIQNKIGQFTSNPLIRNIIGQEKSSFDLRQMMDARKIIIVNLSKGLVGDGNAKLLGSMIVTKMYLAAMSRADVPELAAKNLAPCYLYVDEFQSFANKSFADILSEARKYKLALTIAHQYIEQMEEEVAAAVFGNIGTMVTFRVGARDAEFLEKEFAPQFLAEDLVNLGFVQIYLKLMIDGISSPPFSATTLPPIAPPKESFKAQVIAASRRQFAIPRAVVEEKIKVWHAPSAPIAPMPTPDRRPNVPPHDNRGKGYWQERKQQWGQERRQEAFQPVRHASP
ncbi:MAG: type IV secretion system DNA-binding domain-containing protein, partial [bacterium]|nr:type IV secretion system DNA-binding domain-containing protein [bacterium]